MWTLNKDDTQKGSPNIIAPNDAFFCLFHDGFLYLLPLLTELFLIETIKIHSSGFVNKISAQFL